jgi:hypothetical protein
MAEYLTVKFVGPERDKDHPCRNCKSFCRNKGCIDTAAVSDILKANQYAVTNQAKVNGILHYELKGWGSMLFTATCFKIVQ